MVRRLAVKWCSSRAMATNFAKLQIDEIDVLRSIYMDEFVEGETRSVAWNAVERSFQILLKPDGYTEIAATLSVTLEHTYPRTVPKLHLSFDDAVHRLVQSQMLDVIKTKPGRMVGTDPMIYDIAEALRDILRESLKPKPARGPTLEQERTNHQEEVMLAKAREVEKQREADVSSTHKLEEERREQHRMITQKHKQQANSKQTRTSEELEPNQSKSGVIKFHQISENVSYGSHRFEAGAVNDKVWLQDGTLGPLFTVKAWKPVADTKDHDRRDQRAAPLALKECFISGVLTDEDRKDAVGRLETHLESDIKRHQLHPNVMAPISYLFSRCDDPSTLVPGWKVSILLPLADRGSLSDYIDCGTPVPAARTWSLQILAALNHRNSKVAHGGIHLNNILLQTSSDENIVTAQLADGYAHEFHLLNGKTASRFPLKWRAPEEGNAPPSPATDIWNFGVCLVQMIFGKAILKDSSPSSFQTQTEVRRMSSFAALVRDVFRTKPQNRPTAFDLMHYEFFRDTASLTEPGLYGLSGQYTAVNSSSTSLAFRDRRLSSAAAGPRPKLHFSTYKEEFEQLGPLGKGGFGEVFKAQKRTDNQLYAVKKVKAASSSALDPVLSEVSLLSRLNHPNVVRYFNSWIEDNTPGSDDDSGSDYSSEEEESSEVETRSGQLPRVSGPFQSTLPNQCTVLTSKPASFEQLSVISSG